MLRILPRLNEDVNEEWLGDKSRFAVDGLKRRRLDKPWVRRDGKLVPATWGEAFAAIAARMDGLSGDRIGAIAGDLCDAESMMALKDLMAASFGSHNIDCRQDGARVEAGRRDFYLFNTTIAGIEDADALLIVGSNPRREAPVLNARIRKRWIAGGFPIAAIGQQAELTYDVDWLGEGPSAINMLHEGAGHEGCAKARHAPGTKAPHEGSEAGEALRGAKKPMIIVGAGGTGPAGRRRDPCGVLAAGGSDRHALARLARFQRAAHRGGPRRRHDARLPAPPGEGGRTAASMLDGGVDLLWLLGADEIDTGRIPASTPSSSTRAITAMPAPPAPT